MNRKIIREYDLPKTTPRSGFSKPEPPIYASGPLHQQSSPGSLHHQGSAVSSHQQSSSGFSHQNNSSRSDVKTLGVLATPQSRLIAFLIDAAVFGFGLGIIWIIWFITLAEKGTTPGHYLMGQVVVDAKTGQLFGWKKMVVREVLIKGFLNWLLGSFVFMANYIVDASFIFTSRQRTLHDLMVGSQVIQYSDKTIIKKLKVDEIDGWLNK